MAEFTADAGRFDPYRNFRFRVRWEGREVAGFSKVSALRRTTEVVEHRDGTDQALVGTSASRSEYEAITLERGITHDPEFEKWAQAVRPDARADRTHSAPTGRGRDILIDMHNEAGQKVLTYTVHRCWVSEFQALPELDASGNAVVIQRMRLEHEGWERDDDEADPSEPRI